MTIPEARKRMTEIAKRHTVELQAEFSPDVAILMLKALSAFCDASQQQCAEGKDTRDCVITLSRQMSESDNASEILAKETADTLLGL